METGMADASNRSSWEAEAGISKPARSIQQIPGQPDPVWKSQITTKQTNKQKTITTKTKQANKQTNKN